MVAGVGVLQHVCMLERVEQVDAVVVREQCHTRPYLWQDVDLVRRYAAVREAEEGPLQAHVNVVHNAV